MTRILSLLCLLFLMNLPAQAANFSPTLLTVSAPPVVQYNFDGSELSLPVTVSGTPANVTFLVFTKDRAAMVHKVQNGYLGWHYMNNIDTCIYMAPMTTLAKGSGSIVWNGMDKDGKMVPPGAYTYYLWGIDNISPRTKMTSVIPLGWESRDYVQTHAGDGAPLAQPVVWNASYQGQSTTDKVDYTRKKWVIGCDPDDATLVETCTYKTWAENSSLALDPTDNTMFFDAALNNAGRIIAWKMKWVPNGAAIIQTDWGQESGQTSWNTSLSPGWAYMGGAVSDGADLLFFPNSDLSDAGLESNIVYVETSTGKILRKLDTANWWVDLNDRDAGAQANGGPTDLVFLKGRLHASSHSSCMNQTINPYNEDDLDATLWVNQNGDYTGDHNFEEGSSKAWICNDYNVGPYKYQATMDDNFFTSFSAYDMGAVTFGLYAPDGTGMGYIALSGETSGFKAGQYVVDYGSNYDGYYSDNASAADTAQQAGWWFSAHDSIKGAIVSSASYLWVSSPNGGEVWGTGTPHSITWQSSGVDQVKIEYSTDSGASWKLLADGVNAASGSCSWTPEGVQSDQCLIRVTNASDPSLQGVSRAPFTITPPFVKLTAPNGGEVYETGSARIVSWTFLGIENVKIEYSLDNGSTWTTVSEAKAANGSCSWKVPETASEHCLVRVSDAANASLFDVSDAAFQIMASFVQVTAPNGGEEWEARTVRTIKWQASSGVKNVRIEFSNSDGNTWSILADSVPASSGSYTWRIPNSPSPKCRIRIADTANFALSDESDAAFSIIPSQSLLTVYTTQDGLGSNTFYAAAADAKGGVWVGTDGGGASYFDGNTWKTYRKSNSGIVSDGIYVVYPDHTGRIWFASIFGGVGSYDGASWRTYPSGPNSVRDIVEDANAVLWMGTYTQGLWRYDGSVWKSYTPKNSGLKSEHPEILGVDIDNTLWVGYKFGSGVSRFDGTTWTHFTTANGLVSDEVRAIAIDKNGVKWFGTTNGLSRFDGKNWKTFRTGDGLINNSIWALTIDREGVLWVGTDSGVSAYDGVSWKSYGHANSDFPEASVWKATVDANNGKWFVTRGGGVVSLFSQQGPYVFVSSPNGGELWESGSNHEITWVSKDVERIRIDYTLNGGSTWNLLAGNVDTALKSSAWTIPRDETSSCKVRLTDVSDEKRTDASNSVFTISPPFVRVTAPNGGERWYSGSAYSISWIALGAARIRLEYSTDGGGSWHLINTVDAASGAFAWDVPQVESTDCRVRATDADASERTDTGDAAFAIMKPSITVTAPNGGENWEAGQTMQISWSASSGVSSVRIEVSSDGGTSWKSIVESAAAPGGVYSWHIPNISSSKCLIRISDPAETSLSDTSDTPFTIVPSTSQWITYTTADGLGSNSIWTVVNDYRGGVWIGSGETWSGNGGISYFNGSAWTTYTTKNSGIAADNVYALVVDHNGVVWVGTTWNGLSRFDGTTWENFSKDTSALPDNDIRDLIVDQNNVLWITTWHGGVISITGNAWKTYGAIPHGEILAIDVDNTLWVGYNFGDGGVSHFDGTSWKRYYKGDGLAGNYVLGIAVDRDGKKWFATSGGITTFDGASWYTYNYCKGNSIQAVAIDHDGVKWFGYSGGVVSFDGKDWKTYTTGNSDLSSNNVWRITVDSHNVKWFATRDKGVSSLFSSMDPYVRVASPNGGEIWKPESVHEITWVSKDVERIRIDYTLDGGSSWNLLADNVETESQSYTWTLPQTESASCKVRLTDVSNEKRIDASNGVFTITNTVSVSESIPREFSVSPNSPNPFNPSTTISFSLPRSERVKVDVYNLSGQRVVTVLESHMEPGWHSVVWNAEGLSAGVYLGLVRAGTDVKTIKMLFLK